MTGLTATAAVLFFALFVGAVLLLSMAFVALGLLALNAATLGFTVPFTWHTVFWLAVAKLLLLPTLGSGNKST